MSQKLTAGQTGSRDTHSPATKTVLVTDCSEPSCSQETAFNLTKGYDLLAGSSPLPMSSRCGWEETESQPPCLSMRPLWRAIQLHSSLRERLRPQLYMYHRSTSAPSYSFHSLKVLFLGVFPSAPPSTNICLRVYLTEHRTSDRHYGVLLLLSSF